MNSRPLIAIPALLLAACQPPATENYAERAPEPQQRDAPMAPIDAPDTQRAIWSAAKQGERIVYGVPGQTPLLSLSCEEGEGESTVRITRFVATDAEADAIMALIGNGHRARLPIEAVWNGQGWLWESSYPASLPDLDVFTGLRAIEATIPGAGTVVLNPSPLPARLVEQCRGDPVTDRSPE